MTGRLPPVPGVHAPAAAHRFGIKGPAAAAWLQQQGLDLPALPNRVVHWPAVAGRSSGRCLRLGSTEFLVEQDLTTDTPQRLPTAGETGAHLLLRCDFSLLLDGPDWPDALAQATSFDFSRLRDEKDMVVMTLLAGIAATLVREPTADDRLALRLWCDASYATYLLQCLRQLNSTRITAHGDSP